MRAVTPSSPGPRAACSIGSTAAEGRDYGVVSLATWRVGDPTLKHKLLVAGLGWGGMPEPMVRADIEAGRLVRLDLRDWRGGEFMLQVVHKIETPAGPAGRWLIERLALSSPDMRAADLNPELTTTISSQRSATCIHQAIAARLRIHVLDAPPSLARGSGSIWAQSFSPNSSSGMPKTAQSCTPGMARSAASISAG